MPLCSIDITEYLKKINFLSCIGNFTNVELFCNMGGALFIFYQSFDCASQKLLLSKVIVYEKINILWLLHRHVDGILACYEKIYKSVNVDQPKADVFSQGNLV